ncbi:glycosyltransferase family 2 protein [Exiguobacterium sp. SH0S2]|uniref:glycosyltransferase family 2 protein n=1 Tax=Exiguobacterium sp. SH0S2 TaxID=2510950 RepID=UPI00137605C2|nr:glycosyltransferase [Exiguobacterium sp. SH0S2]
MEINLNQLSVVYVIYNDFHILKKTISSTIEANPLEIIIVDNSPKASNIAEISSCEKIKYFHTGKNLGYAGGANYGFNLISPNTNWVTIMNADAFFDSDYYDSINSALNKVDGKYKIGSIGSKLLKYDFEKMVKTKIIDSAGIKIFSSGRAIDRGQHEKDTGQYDKDEIVDGICGALVSYNVDIIKKINNGSYIFDEKFHAYKEDIDIAISLKKNGYDSFYVGNVVAHHGRGLGRIKKWPVTSFIKSLKKQSPYLKTLSRSNHWYMVFKHRNFIFKDHLSLYKFSFRTMLEIIFLLFFDYKILKKSISRFWKLSNSK